ncbi:MAG: M3 family oligoendopeptidase [Opitutaceae bacterium]
MIFRFSRILDSLDYMSLLPFGKLDPFKPREFVPSDVDLGQWSQIEPLFDQLEQRLSDASDVAALEQWILDTGELSAALAQESTIRYIAMSCHTDDTDAEKAYLHFLVEIEPQLKSRQFRLQKAFLNHPSRSELPRKRYFVYDRDIVQSVELFREENVPLETEESKQSQQYQKNLSALTVEFRGEERTVMQMARFLEEPDRVVRQEAWELTAKRSLQEKEEFEDIFDNLIRLRQEIAANAGFRNFRDYAFKLRRRFDYTPEDCEAFHDAVEGEFVPLLKDLQAKRKEQLGLETMRPWDMSVDPLNQVPLRPFETVNELLDGAQKIFDKVDEELGEYFRLMRERKTLDLESRKRKRPGGYQSTLSEARMPFIFMNAVGMQRDVSTLLHEAGHAFHVLAARGEDIYKYRQVPIEFCEVASMAMELLGGDYLDAFYGEADAKRAQIRNLQSIVAILPVVARIDAFQHWVYTHKNHTQKQRGNAWIRIAKRFGGDVSWDGCEGVRRFAWHRMLHIFSYPFYGVEYGIAQLGAMQVWANSRKDRVDAVGRYRDALALGGSRPLPELFEAAGCKFDFSADTVRPLVQMLRDELAALE